jgi:hypothetical protein
MNTLDQLMMQIHGLNDSDLLEASIYYFSEKFDVSSREEVQNKLSAFCAENQVDLSELMSIESKIEKDRESYRMLLRFLLINEAESGDNELQKVQEAVDSVGQKQIITEIALAIILGTLATMYLTAHTRGIEKETNESSYEVKPDGTVVFNEKSEVTYASASSALGSLFSFFKKLPGK